MRKHITAAVSVAAAAVLMAPAAPSAAIAAPPQVSATTAASFSVPANLVSVRQAILKQVNEERSQRGLQVLKPYNWLNNRAQDCSQRQARDSSMYHCAAPANFGRAWAENVAAGQTPNQVVAAWMNSPGHRANILNPRYSESGIGYAIDSAGRTHFTQNFRQP